MMKFQTTKRQESKLYPGVFFTVKILTQGVKDAVMHKVADSANELRDIQADLEDMLQQIPRHVCGEACVKPCPYFGGMDVTYVLTPAESAKIDKLQGSMEVVRHLKINPVYVNTCFVSVEGMEIEGVEGPISAEAFCQFAPTDLYAEVVAAAIGESDLSAKEQKNLDSPTTSPAAVAGQTTDTSVGTASEKATT